MNKTSLAGTSLVAAIPAGILGYLTLMAVLNSMDVMPTTMKVVAILMLLMAAIVLLLPLWIMIYYRGKKAGDATASKGDAATSAVSTSAADEDIQGSFDDENLLADEDLDFAEDADFAENDEFAGDDLEFESDDEFEFEEDDEKR